MGNFESIVAVKAAFPGKYIQGDGVIAQLGGIIGSFGNRGLILSSRTAKTSVLDRFFKDLEGKGVGQGASQTEIIMEVFGGECCEGELMRLADIVKRNSIDVLAGVGGGKAIDTAKIVADRAGIPVIIVPTIASTDAPCSGCAVIYSQGGVFESVYYQKMNPQVVLVDTNVIANAPARFLVAGMGDALATWFEARSCAKSHSMNECGGYSTLAALNLAKLCYDTILKYGMDAKTANENRVVTSALQYVVEANTLLSGIGFESSGLASAHSIHNGLSALEETHSYYHGERVAFGLLAGLHLTGADAAEMDEVYSFCVQIGLPTTFKEIGLANVGRDRLMKAAIKACDPKEGIHHESCPITPEKVLNAMIAANEKGNLAKHRGA
jgi:glycerol dehydrogenase